MASKQNNGFTLVELVVVIIILGIISVIAIPKFLNLQDDAQRASIKGQFSAFDSGVKLYHSLWLTGAHHGRVENLAGYGDGSVDSSETGFPRGISPIVGKPNNYLACKELWHGLTDNTTSVDGLKTGNYIDQITADIGVSYDDDICIYSDNYFIKNNQETFEMEYNYRTGNIIIRSVVFKK